MRQVTRMCAHWVCKTGQTRRARSPNSETGPDRAGPRGARVPGSSGRHGQPDRRRWTQSGTPARKQEATTSPARRDAGGGSLDGPVADRYLEALPAIHP